MIKVDNDLVTIDIEHAGKRLSGTMSFDTFHATLSAMFDEQELTRARAKVAEIEARLGVKAKSQTVTRPRTELDETDAGNGVAEQRQEISTASFLDDLHEMRMRTREKRRRLA